MESQDKPNRHNKRWKDEEDNKLLQELKDNISLKEISKSHERTINSIKLRIEKHAVDMYDKKIEIKQIELLTKLKNIEQVVRDYKNRETKKKIKNENNKRKKPNDIKQLLTDIKFLQSELVIKFNEFRKYYPLMIENKDENKDENKENIDISIIYVDGCRNLDTNDCAWGSVVNKNKVDLIPIYKHLSTDFKYLDLSENKNLQISENKNIKNKVIIAKSTDVVLQHNNCAELLAFLFALRISKDNINVKEIRSDSDLIIKYWSNPTHNTKESNDKEKYKYILESKKLRKIFEKRGGIITKIPGDDNLADLGYHI